LRRKGRRNPFSPEKPGSACAYPKAAPVPIQESALLSGPLEPSNLGYALAKIAGIKLCQAYKQERGLDFISCMPINLYGRGDNYDLQNSHVLPGMMHRMHDAKVKSGDVVLWGSGTPTREFLWSEDLAEACFFLMENYSGDEAINVGTGREISLFQLAAHIADTVEFYGTTFWDKSKPDGTPRRALDCSKIFAMGWRPKMILEEGLKWAYEDFLSRYPNV
jgi:GDP-L-fucose synthase